MWIKREYKGETVIEKIDCFWSEEKLIRGTTNYNEIVTIAMYDSEEKAKMVMEYIGKCIVRGGGLIDFCSKEDR